MFEITGLEVDIAKILVFIVVIKSVKVNEVSGVYVADSLPIMKLKGKQHSVIFEEARNATPLYGIE